MTQRRVRPGTAVALAALIITGGVFAMRQQRSPGITVTPAEVAWANAHASKPASPAALSLASPVYLREEAVICPQMTVTGAYLDGHYAGGEEAGHRALRDLFVHASGDCVRTIDRDRVRVLDDSVSEAKLVKIQWDAGMPPFLAWAHDLSN